MSTFGQAPGRRSSRFGRSGHFVVVSILFLPAVVTAICRGLTRAGRAPSARRACSWPPPAAGSTSRGSWIERENSPTTRLVRAFGDRYRALTLIASVCRGSDREILGREAWDFESDDDIVALPEDVHWGERRTDTRSNRAVLEYAS
jgi:hypothetical protein